MIFKELPRLENEIIKVKVLKLIRKREAVSLNVIKAEYEKYIPKEEDHRESERETFTSEELEKAEQILKSKDILNEMLKLTKKWASSGKRKIKSCFIYLLFPES